MDFLNMYKNEQKSAEFDVNLLGNQTTKQRQGEKYYFCFIASRKNKDVESSGEFGDVIVDENEIKDLMISSYPDFADAHIKFVYKSDGWAVPFIGEIRADGVETDFQQLFGSIAMYLHEKEGIKMEPINKGYQIAMKKPLVFPYPTSDTLIVGFPVEKI